MIKFIRSYLYAAVLLFFVAIIIVQSCKKEDPAPVNPYDSVDYGNNGNKTDTLDPNSFVGIHKNILLTKCAMPGCHDGNFEPDFRTVQSSYNTLVYHKIVKNNADEAFTFRVVPNDTAKSVLHERITNCCFVNQDDRMPQDNIGVPLPDSDIEKISNWIMNGAKDMFGGSPQMPNDRPLVNGYVAFDSQMTRIDTIRVDSIFYNSFVVEQIQTSINIWTLVEDDYTPINELINNKLKLSLDADDFSSSTIVNGVFITFGGFNLWQFTVNTTAYTPGATVFMRYYTNDGDHSTDTEFPTTNLIYPYKTLWSFYIKP